MCGGKRRGVPPLSWLYGPPVLHAILPAVFCLTPHPPCLEAEKAKYGPQSLV